MSELGGRSENWGPKDLVAITFAIVFPTLVTLVYFQWLEGSESSLQQIAFGIGKALQFGFPVAWVWLWHRSKLQRCPNLETGTSEIGRPSPTLPATSRHAILIGIGFGLLVVASMFGIYFLLIAHSEIASQLVAMVQEKVIDMGIDSFWKYVAMGVFYALCHSFLEEYYWRWFVFDLLQKFVSTPLAMTISSLGFMAHHVILLGFFFNWQWTTYAFSFCIAIGGMFWAWQFHETGRLRASWISHMIVDAGIFALGYFLVKQIL